MQTVEVRKEELLDKMRINRKGHRDLFLDAQKGYRKAVIQELDKMLSDARSGKKIVRVISLAEPSDHTDDYDRVIAMLEMSVEDTIKLSHSEFNQYVLDNWSWSSASYSTNSSYSTSSSESTKEEN